MDTSEDNLNAAVDRTAHSVLSLISKAADSVSRPDGATEAMKLTQAALNAANALSVFTMLSREDDISTLQADVAAIKAHLVL